MKVVIGLLLAYAFVYGMFTCTMARNHPPGEATERYCR
jgi:hypothetical protein